MKNSNAQHMAAMLKQVGVALATFFSGRKRLENALQRSEAKFRALYDSTSEAMMLMDEKGFLDCNNATLQMFGCASKEVFCSKHPADLSPPEQPCGTSSLLLANRHIATALEKGSHRFDWACKRADDGKLFFTETLLNAIKLEGKTSLQVIARDVTGSCPR
jgi:PAS domain S-box-containing protein